MGDKNDCPICFKTVDISDPMDCYECMTCHQKIHALCELQWNHGRIPQADRFLKDEIDDIIKQKERSPTFFENKANVSRINTLFGENDKNLNEKFRVLSNKEITSSINSNFKKTSKLTSMRT